jgi:hypothetical protein
MSGECQLCLGIRELRESHVIPAFVGRWMKKDLGGAVFVRAADPGDVRQDTSKVALLCLACELRFSPWEGYFRQRIFDPFLNRQRYNFERDKRLERFVTSLSWRVAVVLLRHFHEVVDPPDRMARVDALLEQWRLYLLTDDLEQPCPTDHELLFLAPRLDRRFARARDLPPQAMSKYVVGDLDPTLAVSTTKVAVFVKITDMLIWSHIEPQDRAGWRGTRVGGSGLIRSRDQAVDAPGVAEFIHSRVRRLYGDGAPDRNRETIPNFRN